MNPVPISFYHQDTTDVARQLLGKRIFHNKNNILTSGIIAETEAYLGLDDPACHTYQGRNTARVQSMYKKGGHSYVYFIYGIHFCFNVVTRAELIPEAVLIRALIPMDGIEIMRRRRKFRLDKSEKDLCSGPGKVCQAMGFDRSSDGLLLNGPEIWIEDDLPFEEIEKNIRSSPRVGVNYAGKAKDWPLRFRINS